MMLFNFLATRAFCDIFIFRIVMNGLVFRRDGIVVNDDSRMFDNIHYHPIGVSSTAFTFKGVSFCMI